MADTFEALPDGQTDYNIEYAVLSTNRTGLESSYDISRLITDFEIYEHLDKPYLTGNLVFSNPHGVIERLDMQGGEKVTISIKSTHKYADSIAITKVFYVENIRAIGGPDQIESVMLRIVEDIAFISSLKNISRSFSGSPSTIIQKILLGYLNRSLLTNEETYQDKMKVLIPNLHPIEAVSMIKNKATNNDGLPFYLFSTFADDNLRFYNLGSMMKKKVMNKRPYVYWQSASQSLNSNFVTVQSFTSGSNDNLLELIRNGSIGSNYKFYDTLTGTYQEVNFNASNDVFNNLARRDYFDDNQKRFVFGPDMTVDDIKVADYEANSLSFISSSSTYKNFGDYKTINEETDEGSYRKRVISNSIRNFMTKTPMTIQVNGRDFIQARADDDPHYTIGNKIRFLMLDPLTDKLERAAFDKKKSGDYIIYAAKHSFKKERYDIQLLCTKLASYIEDPEI